MGFLNNHVTFSLPQTVTKKNSCDCNVLLYMLNAKRYAGLLISARGRFMTTGDRLYIDSCYDLMRTYFVQCRRTDKQIFQWTIRRGGKSDADKFSVPRPTDTQTDTHRSDANTFCAPRSTDGRTDKRTYNVGQTPIVYGYQENVYRLDMSPIIVATCFKINFHTLTT